MKDEARSNNVPGEHSKVAVVVVTYNSEDVVGACLERCCHMPTVVVDNASADDTPEQVRRRPGIRLIANSRNQGFAAAVNQGVQASDAEFILLLNPDVRLRSAITPLLDQCRRLDYGMASGQLLDSNGDPQVGFNVRRLPGAAVLALEVMGLNRLMSHNPVNRKYRCLDLDSSQPADVEQPAGAFLLFRRDLWMRLGGFDEGFYPLWFEDVDFCKRALDLGVKIRYVPEVTADHQGGHSVSQMGWAHRQHFWYVSLLRYASKHFRSNKFRAVSVAVLVGSAFRAVFGAVQRRSLEPFVVYASVVKLAAGCALRGRMPEPAPRNGSAGSSRVKEISKAN